MSSPLEVVLFLHYKHVTPAMVSGRDVVVLDVLRATSTLASAMARGATVETVASVTRARARARSLGHKAILVGERRGFKIPGFIAGNSPTELCGFDLNRKVVVLTTSNGTRAFARCAGARNVYAAALMNANAVADYLATRSTRPLAFVSAGRSSGVALEDIVGAGAVIDRLSRRRALGLTDSAKIGVQLFQANRRRLGALLASCASGRYLRKIGATADVKVCAELGVLESVPVLRGGRFYDVDHE